MAIVAPRAFLNISAVGNDVCFPVFAPFAELCVQVESVYNSSVPREVAAHFHSCGHSFGPSARALAYAWLAEQLELQTPISDRVSGAPS